MPLCRDIAAAGGCHAQFRKVHDPRIVSGWLQIGFLLQVLERRVSPTPIVFGKQGLINILEALEFPVDGLD